MQELFFSIYRVTWGETCAVGMVSVMGWAICCVWRPTESLFYTKFACKQSNFDVHFDTSEVFHSIRKFSSFN